MSGSAAQRLAGHVALMPNPPDPSNIIDEARKAPGCGPGLSRLMCSRVRSVVPSDDVKQRHDRNADAYQLTPKAARSYAGFWLALVKITGTVNMSALPPANAAMPAQMLNSSFQPLPPWNIRLSTNS